MKNSKPVNHSGDKSGKIKQNSSAESKTKVKSATMERDPLYKHPLAKSHNSTIQIKAARLEYEPSSVYLRKIHSKRKAESAKLDSDSSLVYSAAKTSDSTNVKKVKSSDIKLNSFKIKDKASRGKSDSSKVKSEPSRDNTPVKCDSSLNIHSNNSQLPKKKKKFSRPLSPLPPFAFTFERPKVVFVKMPKRDAN